MSRASPTHQVPHIGLPHSEPVTSARKVKQRPAGARGLGRQIGDRMAKDDGRSLGERHEGVGDQRHPRGRHMHEHDAHRFALLVVGRRRIETERRARRRTAPPWPPRPTGAAGRRWRRTGSDWRIAASCGVSLLPQIGAQCRSRRERHQDQSGQRQGSEDEERGAPGIEDRATATGSPRCRRSAPAHRWAG